MSDLDAFNTICPTINISQHPDEIIWFMSRVRGHVPTVNVLVEMGCWTGGNISLLSKVVSNDGLVVGVNPVVDHHEDWIRVDLVSNMITPVQFMHLPYRSDDPECFNALLGLLNGRRIDVLFMDHTDLYEEARYDYDTYSELMSPSGVMGWHDVQSYPEGPGRVYDEASQEYRGDSIRITSGIGVIYRGE